MHSSVYEITLAFFGLMNYECVQIMVKDFKFFTTKQGKSMNHTMITSLMSSILRMEVNGWLQCLCICKICLDLFILRLPCSTIYQSCLQNPCSKGRMLKKAVKQCFLLPIWILVLYHGIMSSLSVGKRDFPLSREWAMHCFSGAWGPMLH